MSRRLILIRHSMSEIRREVPASEWRLSAEGVSRARAFAARFDPGTATCVYTSEEPKAVETAHAMAGVWDLPVEQVAGLHEHERPEARIFSREEFDDRMRELFERPAERVFGAETAEQAHRRFSRAVLQLVQRTTTDLVVVTHGTVIALFVAAANGLDAFRFWQAHREMPSAVTLSLPELRVERGLT